MYLKQLIEDKSDFSEDARIALDW
jgi:hypothetical protein